MFQKPENHANSKLNAVFECTPGMLLLNSSDYKIISINSTQTNKIPDFKTGEIFIESISEIIPKENQGLLNEIKSVLSEVITQKQNRLLDQKQYNISLDGIKKEYTIDLNFIPLLNEDIVQNILVLWNYTPLKGTKTALEKIFELEKKLFSVSQKDISFDTTLNYIINIIEENLPDLLCTIIIAENGNFIQKSSEEFPKPFLNIIKDKALELSLHQKNVNEDIVEEFFSLMKSNSENFHLQPCKCYSLTGAENTFLGILNIFCKKERNLTLDELKLLKIVVEISVIIIESENLNKHQNRHREILDEVSDSFPGVIFQFMRDSHGEYHFTYFTQKIKMLFNLELDEIYKDTEKIFRQVHPDDYNGLMNSIDKSAQTLEPWFFVYRVKRRKANKFRWIRGNAVPTKKGDIITWNGTLIDITEFHEEAEKTIESEKRYRLIFEKNPLALMIFEKDSLKLLEVNSTTINTFGYEKEELLELELADLIPGEDYKKLLQSLKDLKEGKDLELHIKNRKKNGEIIHVEFLITEFNYQGTKAYMKIVTDVSEKRKTEELVNRQNLLFKELFNASPFGIVLFDKMAKVKKVNKAFEGLFQFNFEEIENKHIEDFIFPKEKKEKFIEKFQAGKKLDLLQMETQVKRKNGSFFEILMVIYPIINNKELMGFYGIYVDISSQKEAENSIKREKYFTDSIINSIPEIIYVIKIENEKLKLVLWNENLRKVTGYKDEQIKTITLGDLFKGNDDQVIKEKIRQAIENGKSETEATIVSKSGKETLYYFTGVLAEIENQKYIIGMGLDVTERSQYQQMLHIHERAFESVAEGVIITDNTKPNNPIIYVNPEFCRITGYSEEEVIGKSIFLLNGSRTRRKIIKEMQDAIEYERKFRGELLSYCKDGTSFWNLMVLAPVFNKYKKATHFVGMINDITDIKNWQQQLEENNINLQKANEELDRFVYSTSHDLRAPLTSVLGLINISMAESNPELIKDFLIRMRNSVLRLDSFIQDIVNYSRNSRLEVLKNEVNMESLLSDIKDKLEFMEGYKNIDFKINIQDDQKFYSDKNRLNIILSNIISNAIKYQDPGKDYNYVRVDIKILKNKACIKIEDNGTGISRLYQKKVFEMFFRASE
ncbi:MAG: PAS domain S-box protein, partial [Bacteroidota bacterium]|nr:PAS domain S-box protein [Bacteroidota bacterium]